MLIPLQICNLQFIRTEDHLKKLNNLFTMLIPLFEEKFIDLGIVWTPAVHFTWKKGGHRPIARDLWHKSSSNDKTLHFDSARRTRYKRFPRTKSCPTKGEQTDQKRGHSRIQWYSQPEHAKPNTLGQLHIEEETQDRPTYTTTAALPRQNESAPQGF